MRMWERLRAWKRERDRLRKMRRGRVRMSWQICQRCRCGFFALAGEDRFCGGCRNITQHPEK